MKRERPPERTRGAFVRSNRLEMTLCRPSTAEDVTEEGMLLVAGVARGERGE